MVPHWILNKMDAKWDFNGHVQQFLYSNKNHYWFSKVKKKKRRDMKAMMEPSPRDGFCLLYTLWVRVSSAKSSSWACCVWLFRLFTAQGCLSKEQVVLKSNLALCLPSYETWWKAAMAQRKRSFFQMTSRCQMSQWPLCPRPRLRHEKLSLDI